MLVRRHILLAVLTTAIAVSALPEGAAAQGGKLKLPVVRIDTAEEIADDPKRAATMHVFDRQGREEYSGHIGIERRGYGSQRHPKQSYALETRRASGEDRPVSLLGMPADDEWVLIANYPDESLLRNFLAYSTARWLGRYAARTRLVEVAVNGSYEGVYTLAEQLKLHDSRVRVDDSDISGGYLLHMIRTDRTRGEQFFTTPVERQPIVYKDPERDQLSYGRAQWIRDYVNRLELRLYNESFRDRRRGYRRYLDLDAAVDYLLLNELFRNQGTFWFSTHMHKGAGGKLVLGPIWDFDLAIGNCGAPFANQSEGWQYAASPWAERFYADPTFRGRMARRWRQLREQGMKSHIMRTIDRGLRRLAGGPQERNFSRWRIFERQRSRGPRDPRTGRLPANHAEAVDYLKWWVTERIKWIDSALGY